MSCSRVSFTGHRPDKISGWKVWPATIEKSVRAALRRAIVEASGEGAEVFNSGAAPGVDLWAADEILLLRAEGTISPTTRLRFLLPYPRFADSFDATDRALYDSIVARMEECDEVVAVSEHYHPGCYNLRNDRLADECDLLIAYYEGATGGTRYTLHRARKQGCTVRNLVGRELF